MDVKKKFKHAWTDKKPVSMTVWIRKTCWTENCAIYKIASSTHASKQR